MKTGTTSITTLRASMARQFLTAVNEETLVMDMVTARASLGVFN
jgi:hypothetical protein